MCTFDDFELSFNLVETGTTAVQLMSAAQVSINVLKRQGKLGFPIFLKSTNQVSIEFRIRNTLLQKFLHTDMISFDQFILYTVNLESSL